jgi:hypothetical protein
MTVERTATIPTPASYDLCEEALVCEEPEVDPDDLICAAPVTTSARGTEAALTAAVDAFFAASVGFGVAMTTDAKALAGFAEAAKTTVAHLMLDVERGRMTLAEATSELQHLRGSLELQREACSSDVRRAWAAVRGSKTGETFYAAQKRVATELFGAARELSPEQLRTVHMRLTVELTEEGVAAARLGVTMSRAGYGFLGISAAFAVHNIATAESPGAALAREAIVLGAGKIGAGLGAAAGGALCGPGAPVCVPVGALVGDVLFSMGAGALFDAAFGD